MNSKLEGISSGTVPTHLNKTFGLRKVDVRWIPHILTEKHKNDCRYRKHFKICTNCNEQRLLEILTGDET